MNNGHLLHKNALLQPGLKGECEVLLDHRLFVPGEVREREVLGNP